MYCRMLPVEHSPILCHAFSDNRSLKPILGRFESGRFTKVLLYNETSKIPCIKPGERNHQRVREIAIIVVLPVSLKIYFGCSKRTV